MVKKYLNYFYDSESKLVKKINDARTKLVMPIAKRLAKVVEPDTVSYLGFAMIFGFIYFVKSNPLIASLFLFTHIILDCLDGPIAKCKGKASDSGALTDIITDHSFMVAFVIAISYFGLTNAILGIFYVYLYTLMIVFIIVINRMGLKSKVIFRSKYILYLLFFVYALSRVNLLGIALLVFAIPKVYFIWRDYLILKRELIAREKA